MAGKHYIDFKWHKEHMETIAQGCLTNSKHPDRFIKGFYPNMVESAKGAFITSSQNEKYLDFICGLGTCLLGYAQRDINAAIINEVSKGYSYSLASKTEVRAGRRVKELFPFAERVKFLKTGTEAAMASIRIARAYTGRKFVLSSGYHGWSDEFVGMTPPAAGVVNDVYMRKLNDINQITKDIAAVIVEPVELDNSRDRVLWLNSLREKCNQTGTVLIFDEIITGFRYKSWSVSNYLNIRPDIILLGKSMSNGLPLAAVGGQKELMDNDQYFVSSTFAGENISLASFIKLSNVLASDLDIGELWENGETFRDKFNSIWPEKIYIEGYSVRGVFRGDPLVIATFWQEAVRAGYLFGPSWFFMFPHIEHMYSALENISDILNLMKIKMPKLKGPMPSSPFSVKQRK